MVLTNVMSLSLAACIQPLTAPDGPLALIKVNSQHSTSQHQRPYRMGPGLCYNCCSVQLLQATDLPAHALTELLLTKFPIKFLFQCQRLLLKESNIRHLAITQETESQASRLTWVPQVGRSALNLHILLLLKHDGQSITAIVAQRRMVMHAANIVLSRTSLREYLSDKTTDSKKHPKHLKTFIFSFNKY